MAVLDERYIDNLLAIQWFSRCGEPVADVDGVGVEAVGSWAESLALWNTDALNTLHGEQRSRLQLHLFNRYRKQHAVWNEMVDLVETRLASGGVQEALSLPLFNHGFNDLHVSVVMSEVTLAIMESSYASINCRMPHFFRTILRVYSVGHLPCGWVGGEFPQGRLVAY